VANAEPFTEVAVVNRSAWLVKRADFSNLLCGQLSLASALHVLSMSDRLKVIGSNARRLFTQMVKFVARRDQSIFTFIGFAMGESACRDPVGVGKDAVAVFLPSSEPDPAWRRESTVLNPPQMFSPCESGMPCYKSSELTCADTAPVVGQLRDRDSLAATAFAKFLVHVGLLTRLTWGVRTWFRIPKFTEATG